MARLKTAILISGRGSNLQALIEECQGADAAAEIALVLSNVADAGGLARAEKSGIATQVIDHQAFGSRESFEAEITACLEQADIEMICLAGFMRLLTPSFVSRWHDSLINIHPSLLPSYKGLDTHERAIADGVRFAGCTVHFVRAEMDAGPIIVQAAVPVHAGDDAGDLAARVLAAEHRCYPLALRMIAEGRVKIENERVLIDGAVAPDGIQVNPESASADT